MSMDEHSGAAAVSLSACLPAWMPACLPACLPVCSYALPLSTAINIVALPFDMSSAKGNLPQLAREATSCDTLYEGYYSL